MLSTLREQVKPAGETAEVRVTVPAKPLTGETATVEASVSLALMVTLDGLAAMVKSVTMKVAVAV